MKRSTIILCLFLALIVEACQQPATTDLSKFKTITIKSTGEVETLPNEATFHVNLTCLEPSASASKECLVEKSNALTKQLQEFGIDKKELLTTAVDLNKSYTWRNNSRVFEGYRSSTLIYVTVKDLDKLDLIYSELLENRNLELGGLSYNHTDLDNLKNEAYLKALDKAAVLSDRLLEKLPETKKEILKIGNVAISASMPEQQQKYRGLEVVEEQSAAANVDAQSISINKGTVKVTATLFVEYQIN